MAHVAKYTRGAVGHLAAHYERGYGADGELIRFGNQSIDPTLSSKNYNLAPHRAISQGEFVRQRCSEVKCLNRKDVNVMCDWVVTAPRTLSESQYEKFFREAYVLLEARYGANNTVSAYVHMDETTPHLHFAFVPISTTKGKNGQETQRVSAKDVISRQDLKTFHKDLTRHMERAFGQDIGVENGSVQRQGGNLTIETLKGEIGKSLQEHKRLTESISDTTETLQNLTREVEALRDKNNALQAETDAMEQEREELKNTIEEYQELHTTAKKVDRMGKKTLFGHFVKYSEEDSAILVKQAKAYRVNRNEIRQLRNKKEKLDAREKTIQKREANVDALYNEQQDLNLLYQQATQDRESLTIENIKLSEEATKATEENKKLTQALAETTGQIRKAYEFLGSVVKAVGMLKYDQGEYQVKQLTPKQEQLIDGLTQYVAARAKTAHFEDIAADVQKHIGISNGIENTLREQQKRKKQREDFER